MTRITRLGLCKLFLWSEAERFQTYPQAMSRLTGERTYTRRQIGTELLDLTYIKERNFMRRASLLQNLFGVLQTSQDKLLLRGINLFRRVTPNGLRKVPGKTRFVWQSVDDEWIPTTEAIQLGQAYHQAPDDIHWQQLLATQLARYEPRTRVLLYLLSHGYALHFQSPGYFSGNTQRAQLIGQNSYALFSEQGAAFNSLLFEYADVAVGPWWRKEIENAGFDLAVDCTLEGANNRPPSTNYINSALKTALYVFYMLDILTCDDESWEIDADAFAQHLGSALCQDILGKDHTAPPDLSDEWERLIYVIDELADDRGFIIASAAANRWGELGFLPPETRAVAFDKLIQRGIFDGHVEILDRHLGQPRMGPGLLGDENMRLVKLRVLI